MLMLMACKKLFLFPTTINPALKRSEGKEAKGCAVTYTSQDVIEVIKENGYSFIFNRHNEVMQCIPNYKQKKTY